MSPVITETARDRPLGLSVIPKRAALNTDDFFKRKMSRFSPVARNNSFCRTFSRCWRESVQRLQYYCQSLYLCHILLTNVVLYFGKNAN